MGSSTKSGGTEITRYYTSLHAGICLSGEGIELLAIYGGEQVAWSGAESNDQDLYINKEDLFGGDKKEGGLKGVARWMPGKVSQIMTDFLASKFGLTPSTMPAYRGIASVFFTGGAGSTLISPGVTGPLVGIGGVDPAITPTPPNGGFMFAANNPYLKDLAFLIRRPSIGLNPAYAMIQVGVREDTTPIYGSNPAHMIYECQTSSDFGEAAPASAFNLASYEAVAQTLFDEDFGLAATWMRSAKIESLVNEIIDHIQAVQFDDPDTGLRTIKLLRGDYDVATLREINPDNATLTNFQRKMWGESGNEVSVTWTNPLNDKEETVTAHDLAAIASMSGEIVPVPRNYYMVRNEGLAQKLAERDLAASVFPIASCDAEVDRSLWNAKPGDVVKLVWPEHGITQSYMRVMEVGYGNAKAGKVTLRMIEDIFGIGSTVFNSPGETLWVNPRTVAAPITNRMLTTAPAYLAAKALGKNDVTQLVSPEAATLVLAARNTPDYNDFDLYAPVTLVNGTVQPVDLGTKAFTTRALLNAPMVQESTTFLVDIFSSIGTVPSAGDMLFIGEVADNLSEIAVVQSVGASGVEIKRGLLDTTPKAWTTGTPIYIAGGGVFSMDNSARVSGESVDYRLLPRTSVNQLAYADAPVITTVLSDRAHKPLRPANVKVNGVGFGPVNAVAPSFSVTWAQRNRIMESSQVIFWDAADVTPESGQTTTVKILNAAGATLWTSAGLTGTSVTVTISSIGAAAGETVRVQVFSSKGGVLSLQGHEILVNLP